MITSINEFKQRIINEAINYFELSPELLKGRSPVKEYFIDVLLQGPSTIGELTSSSAKWQNVSRFRNDLVDANVIELNIVNGKRLFDFTDAYKQRHNLLNESMIKESIGDISLTEIDNKRFNESFIKLLNSTFTKEPNTTADWAGINAWHISGDTSNGYFIVQDETKNPYEVGFDLIYRYDDEDANTQSDIIDSINTSSKKEADRFIDVAKSYIEVQDLNERSEFDAIATIGKITKNITIELDLKHSMHSMERQGRSSEYIKNSDIKATVDKATPQVIDLLINNTLNVGDPVWIYDSSNDLNVVGSLLANKNTDVITFKVITCMFHKNFYNKNNTYKVTV